MVPTTINGRWTLLLPEHRYGRPEWPWWEATRLAAMHHFIGAGDVVVDVGAEEGDFPALFAQWGADVVLIEPNPLVWPNIKAIFEANELTSKYKGAFVGFASDVNADSGDGLVTWGKSMWTPGYWPDCADGPVIGNHGFRHLAQETDTTPQMTIDTIVDHMFVRTSNPDDVWSPGPNADGPTHITMDIEGSELTALRGATRTMTDYRPYVWVSVHKDTMLDFYCANPDEVYKLMEEHDYERVFLTYDHESHELFVPREKMWPR